MRGEDRTAWGDMPATGELTTRRVMELVVRLTTGCEAEAPRGVERLARLSTGGFSVISNDDDEDEEDTGMREGPTRRESSPFSLAGLTLLFRCVVVRAGDFDGALVLAGVFLAGLLAAGDLRAGLLGAGDLGRPGLLGRAVFGRRAGLFGAGLFLAGLLAFLAGLGDLGVAAFFCGDRGVLGDVTAARDALRLRLRLVTRFVLGDLDAERLRVVRLRTVTEVSVSTLLFLGGAILACYAYCRCRSVQKPPRRAWNARTQLHAKPIADCARIVTLNALVTGMAIRGLR